MQVETDDNGRIRLPSELRQKYGERFHVVKYQNRIELIPIAENPLQAAREAVGDAFEGESVASLGQTARERAEREAGPSTRDSPGEGDQ
mgnify:CR=1 FL=1